MARDAPDRRRWSALEPPQVALLALGLLALDLLTAGALVLVLGDYRCHTGDCQAGGVSVLRPAVGLSVAVVVGVVPVLIACVRRVGVRTTATVQAVAGALLVWWTVTATTAALAVHRDPPVPVPSPSLRPCVSETLAGRTCLTYPPTTSPPGAD